LVEFNFVYSSLSHTNNLCVKNISPVLILRTGSGFPALFGQYRYQVPVNVPGAEVGEVAELGGKHPLGAVAVGQLDGLLNLLCEM